ncbi:uncharacterized protein LOC114533523 [Dendronephthya gigantea]|uniref:uncharacterized protein LOC114533523 n=1 Tax=Dendronephthya gigantea TaxID=151771 RepID=UPI00106CDEBC|nr:uncharacterized protein LOC114533523 [Dendronephthya gigantea]
MVQILRRNMICCFLQSLLFLPLFSQKVIGRTRLQGNCVVRDGRDGVRGPPGIPGHPGPPGRDGRDCTANWSLDKVFELEKRLSELNSKYQFIETNAQEMKEELVASKQQAQQLFQVLAAKKILEPDILGHENNLLPAVSPIRHHARIGSILSTPEPTLTPTDTPVRNQKCKTRLAFHVHDRVKTKGAVNMEIFTIGQSTFLAAANFHAVPDGYNTASFIYKMNSTSEKFEKLQTLPTIGCRSITYVSSQGNSYLVAANHYNGRTHVLDSAIYRWNGHRFVNYTNIETQGASASEFFEINGESYLVFANYRNDTSVSIFSVVYRWNRGNLEIFQKIPTHGAVDCKFFRSKAGRILLVFANYYSINDGFKVKSVVYQWNGRRFVFAQSLRTSAAISVDLFENNDGLFLVFASHRSKRSWHSETNVFRWNGTEFALFQKLQTTAAIKVNHFVADGIMYLTIAKYFDVITSFETHSMIYRFKDGRFGKFQRIPTTGAYDLQPFTHRGVSYLAAAFRFNGVRGNLKSKIYKMHKGCVKNVLP